MKRNPKRSAGSPYALAVAVEVEEVVAVQVEEVEKVVADGSPAEAKARRIQSPKCLSLRL